jgi:hypothetical protein
LLFNLKLIYSKVFIKSVMIFTTYIALGALLAVESYANNSEKSFQFRIVESFDIISVTLRRNMNENNEKAVGKQTRWLKWVDEKQTRIIKWYEMFYQKKCFATKGTPFECKKPDEERREMTMQDLFNARFKKIDRTIACFMKTQCCTSKNNRSCEVVEAKISSLRSKITTWNKKINHKLTQDRQKQINYFQKFKENAGENYLNSDNRKDKIQMFKDTWQNLALDNDVA